MILSYVFLLTLAPGASGQFDGFRNQFTQFVSSFNNIQFPAIGATSFNFGSSDDFENVIPLDSQQIFSSFATDSTNEQPVITVPTEPQSTTAKSFYPAFSYSVAQENPSFYATPNPLPIPSFTNGQFYPYPYAQQSGYLSAHNVYRRMHCVNDLGVGSALNVAAAAHAQKCIWGHDSNDLREKGQGENLYASTFNKWFPPKTAGEAVFAWYDEINTPGYNYSNPGFYQNPGAGHFTQVVWASTSAVGCSVYICPAVLNGVRVSPFGPSNNDDWQYVVCRYDPPGNYLNQFPQNVLPPC